MAIIFIIVLMLYDKYGGKKYKESLRQKYVYPLIAKEINGIVIDVYRTDFKNMFRQEMHRRSIQVNYVDIHTNSYDNFDTKLDYEDLISIGDTITKKENQRFFLVRKKGGKLYRINIK